MTLPPQLLAHSHLSHLTTEATLLWICQQIPKICTPRVDVAKEVIVGKTELFQKARKPPEALPDIADAVMERLELPSETSNRIWSSPETSFPEAWWEALENIDPHVNPYTDMLVKKCKNGHVYLAYKNFDG